MILADPPTVEFRTRGIRAWAVVCMILGPIIGRARATRWAEAGMWKLVRWRLKGERRWHRVDPPAH